MSSNTDGFAHKELWSRRGRNFMVQVSRHSETSSIHDPYEGLQRWCVYAYIYPNHPHFTAFNGTEDMFQDAATAMPLHGYASFCRVHWDSNGKMTSYQVGADYNHLHDDFFRRAETVEDAYLVFADARNLFDWLESRDTKPGVQA